MPTPSKTPASNKEKDRRKSSGKSTQVVTLRVPSLGLRKIIDPSSVKEESPVKASPAPSTTLPTEQAPVASNGDNPSPSSPGTPAAAGTPSQTPMGPPTDGPKKKGVKRSAAAANGSDPTAKVRGKPGPKKKPRLDDGTDANGKANGGSYHKLGPKANMGAINAGLRALDRSGKPCRKWNRGGFSVKSFTGVTWEIPRWTAPAKPLPQPTPEEPAATSAESSNKENKDGSQMKSDSNNNSHADVAEQRSIPPSINASSPAPTPVPVAAAS
ncbi:hypothetical protein M426DRAFT_20441 [Hypoxylon sp. CI-4A]|nr:hypothetical protein M426DRAFT_20441 [Hypoxylon sp. CI-4A]